MPRDRRTWEPNAIYHVDARAHDGAPIFAMEEDRAFVLERAARVFAEEGVICLGASVLINHFHLVVRCPGPPGHAMLRLKTALARRRRLRCGGAGAVFQGRFFSDVCTDEGSLKLRLAYVIANPVHHRVVPDVAALRTYAWSTLAEVLGLREAKLAAVDAVLALFGPEPDVARAGLVELLEARARAWAQRTGDPDADFDEDLDGASAGVLRLPRRITDEIRAPRTLRSIHGPLPPAVADWDGVCTRRAVLRAEGWTPARLVGEVSRRFGADPEAVRVGRRTRNETRARAVVAHVACDHLAWPTNEVAAAVGTSSSAVAHCRMRGRLLLGDLGGGADVIVEASRGRAPS